MAGRVRSPNYPMLSLGEAIQRAKQFYNQEGTAHTSPEVAVTAWGYKGLNGASTSVLSAVRHYGLISDGGKDVKITERGLTILLEPEGSPEYREAIRDAARSPKVFAEILDEYPSGLPSDQGLVAYLVRKQGFTEDGAKKLNGVLRATLAIVSQYDDKHIEAEQPERPIQEPPAESRAPGQPAPASARGGDADPVASQGRFAPSPGVRVMQFQHELADGGTATLLLTGEQITLDDLEDVYDWLEIVKRTIQRRVRRAEQGQGDGGFGNAGAEDSGAV